MDEDDIDDLFFPNPDRCDDCYRHLCDDDNDSFQFCKACQAEAYICNYCAQDYHLNFSETEDIFLICPRCIRAKQPFTFKEDLQKYGLTKESLDEKIKHPMNAKKALRARKKVVSSNIEFIIEEKDR
jgi:hypothetical protein